MMGGIEPAFGPIHPAVDSTGHRSEDGKRRQRCQQLTARSGYGSAIELHRSSCSSAHPESAWLRKRDSDETMPRKAKACSGNPRQKPPHRESTERSSGKEKLTFRFCLGTSGHLPPRNLRGRTVLLF